MKAAHLLASLLFAAPSSISAMSLYPLFPSAQIDPPRLNETLAIAANTSLTIRRDSGNGWPAAWRINRFARLLDGETSYHILQHLLKLFSYVNLWSKNSILQVDRNFGGANGSTVRTTRVIRLLPAIPASWREGDVKGFRVRGGYVTGEHLVEGRRAQRSHHYKHRRKENSM